MTIFLSLLVALIGLLGHAPAAIVVALPSLAALTVSLSGLVSIVVWLLIAGCVIGLLFYLIHIVPIPEPYKGWIKIVLQVLIVLFLIGVLLSFAGFPLVQLR